jgi:hypothetical protein
MAMHGELARRLCQLLDCMNVLPGRWHLSAQDVVSLAQNPSRLSSGRAASIHEASSLIADLLPEAKQIVESEAEDRRLDLIATIAYTACAAALLATGIWLLLQDQMLVASMPITVAIAVFAFVFVIDPIIQRRRETRWNALDDELGQHWASFELLEADLASQDPFRQEEAGE